MLAITRAQARATFDGVNRKKTWDDDVLLFATFGPLLYDGFAIEPPIDWPTSHATTRQLALKCRQAASGLFCFLGKKNSGPSGRYRTSRRRFFNP